MLKLILCILNGYLLGSLSPSALFSKLKNKNLREHGSGNLGATNTMIVLGKKYGIVVMLFDVLKAYFSIKIANLLLPKYVFADILAGCFTVLGHIFPFYLHFNGGKGVATLAGLLLAIDPTVFVILLLLGIALMFLSNYAVAAPVTASVLAPFMVGIRMQSFYAFLILAIIGTVIILKHKDNFVRIKNGTEVKVHDFFSQKTT